MTRPAQTPPSFPALVQASRGVPDPATCPQPPDRRRLPRRLRAVPQVPETRLGKPPARMALADITPDLLAAFLDDLETRRHNSVRSRNARLAALRSFLKFAAHRDIASLQVVESALGIPVKRFERPLFGYLSREAMLAVIAAPDRTWLGQRDHLLFLLMYNTGARVSEVVGARVGDLILDGKAACIHLWGKGRKQRSVPLWRSSVKAVRAWLRANPGLQPGSPLLPSRQGGPMTRANVTQRLALAVEKASTACPELAGQHVSPHTIRHTTAMHLLQSGVDLSVIALWLGHENPATTHHYLEADLAMKEQALARLHDPDGKIQPRYRAPDSLIDFLHSL